MWDIKKNTCGRALINRLAGFKKKKKTWFATFVDFHGVNTLTMASVKLST